jgi:hypothetical protein
MFFISLPKQFKIGDTVDCRINLRPARVTWRDADTLGSADELGTASLACLGGSVAPELPGMRADALMSVSPRRQRSKSDAGSQKPSYVLASAWRSCAQAASASAVIV